MAVFKEVWTISGLGNRWQEVWYKSSADLSSALPVPGALISARMACINAEYNLEKIRVSDVEKPHITDYQNVNQVGTDGGVGVELASSGETIVYTLQAKVTFSRRRLNLRGVPSTSFFGQKNNFPKGGVVSTFDTKVKAFTVLLDANGYLIYSRYRPGDTIDKAINVSKVDGSITPGRATITLASPFTVHNPTGGRVRFKRFAKKNLPGLNGSFDVISYSGTSLVVQYTVPENQIIETTSGAVVEEKFHNDGVINALKTQFAFVGARQVKNAGIGSRGARSAQRTRSQV